MQADLLEKIAKSNARCFLDGFDLNHRGNYEIGWTRYPSRSALIDAETCRIIRCQINGHETDEPTQTERAIISARIRYLSKRLDKIKQELASGRKG